ncbi:Gfo/Idh/MocA family oxidoreductase [Streptomyces sp. NPDC005970]|uniref:Gfo/Idh/MocA family protein n=1 Tax=Streptomyces sp. NPDC005970 TaxID=3156723 RepID=UPI003402E3C7
MSSHRSTTPLRTAVVGTGGIARSSHLPALRALADAGEVEIVAAVDVDMDAVRAFAAGAGIPHASTDLDATLADLRPDLVVLCTPPAVHRDQAVTALKAGAWVWCEKPPCPSLADFDAIETAEKPGDAGPYAAIVFQHRFGSGARHVRRLLREGAFGRPLVAHCQTTWYRDAAYYSVPHLYGYRNADWRITPAPGVPEETVAAWRDFGTDEPSSHLAQLRALVADIRAGRRHATSGAGGRQTLEFITALYKSAFTDAPVRAGEIGPGDPYYTELHGGAQGWAPDTARKEEAHA